MTNNYAMEQFKITFVGKFIAYKMRMKFSNKHGDLFADKFTVGLNRIKNVGLKLCQTKYQFGV